MKKAFFLAALVSLAAVFTSCNKDEGPQEIKILENPGTIKFIVRGYAIGTSGTTRIPEAITKGNSIPVPGYQIILTDGRTFTTDANGFAPITLPIGTYFYKAVKPNGYGLFVNSYGYGEDYGDLNSVNEGGGKFTYTIKISPSSADDAFANSFNVSNLHQETVVQLVKY